MTFDDGKRYFFDGFTLDPTERSLSRDGEEISLPGKVFDVLVVLARNPGRLLRKEELIENVWPDEFVEEANLARSVSTLRKALSDTGREHKYIATVQGQGYRFIADVSESMSGDLDEIAENTPETPTSSDAVVRIERPRWIIILVALSVIMTVVWLTSGRFFTADDRIKTLAVLPLRQLGENNSALGLGAADAIIRKLNRTGRLTVRPTSAIYRYAEQEKDSLTAGRELGVDAVLEGTMQKSGEVIRVSVNLLRTTDGSSMWSDSFDMPSKDIFSIQDLVAEKIANHFQLDLRAPQNKYPANELAYEYYFKGMLSLDQRGYQARALPQLEQTISLFKKAIETDPNYALAHAQLAYAYIWAGIFVDVKNPEWAKLAMGEVERAEDLDPNLAETHLVRSLYYWGASGNYRVNDALRELLTAKRMDPLSHIEDYSGILAHLGLEDEAQQELEEGLRSDPTSKSYADLEVFLPGISGDADAILAKQGSPGIQSEEPLAYLRKGRLDDARKSLDEELSQAPDAPFLRLYRAIYLAYKGNADAAEAATKKVLEEPDRQGEAYHHTTYYAACVYAIDGKTAEAIRLLRRTAETGYPDYPLFNRDHLLDNIRNSPEFIQFLSEQKAQWENFRREYYEQN